MVTMEEIIMGELIIMGDIIRIIMGDIIRITMVVKAKVQTIITKQPHWRIYYKRAHSKHLQLRLKLKEKEFFGFEGRWLLRKHIFLEVILAHLIQLMLIIHVF